MSQINDSIDFPLPVAVVGAGVSGAAVLKLLESLGVKKSECTLFDDKPGKADFSNPTLLMEKFAPKTLVVSPGVPLSTPWIVDFKASGGQVLSEIGLAAEYLETERIIAVTGSLGKSTTVSLVGAALQSFEPNAFVGGNLGVPLADYIADCLTQKRSRSKWIVLELSSYQLENCPNFKCELSAITYLTPNHMERYATLEDYYSTKWSLVEKTIKFCVLNKEGGDLSRFAQSHASSKIVWADKAKSHFKDFSKIKLLGAHNQDNMAVAFELVRLAGWPETSHKALREYGGLPHRVENIGTYAGVRFINDSKATTIQSVVTATESVVESLNKSCRLWLLVGGRDKNLPWQDLHKLSKHSQLEFVFFGECADTAKMKSKLEGPIFKGLSETLKNLRSLCKKGDTVLLSPGGTSLDEFKNFEDRGHKYTSLVQEIFK